MTMLRIKIERAKTVYLATAYPGDLAGELLAPVRVRATHSRTFWLGTGGASAVAAALVVSFSVVTHNPSRIPGTQQRGLIPIGTLGGTVPTGITYPGDSRYRMVDDVITRPQYAPQRLPDFIIPQYSLNGRAATQNSDYTTGGR